MREHLESPAELRTSFDVILNSSWDFRENGLIQFCIKLDNRVKLGQFGLLIKGELWLLDLLKLCLVATKGKEKKKLIKVKEWIKKGKENSSPMYVWK